MTQNKKRTKISDLQPGDYFKGTVKVLRANNPGPLFLTITDGFGNIEAIGKDGLFKKGKLENIIQKGGLDRKSVV